MAQEKYRSVGVTIVLAALVAAGLADATVPESINYQGYITNRLGEPSNVILEISFSIYNVSTGSVPLWTDVQSVPISQGLFSLELGSAANPFPVGLFDTPLWLGITVADDSEMTPRKPLTTVGFAFRADEADVLQGKSAADLDQSDHVTAINNPHGTTAAQVGAISEPVLSSHTGNTANPHAVSISQVGGVDGGTFALHAVDPAGHHDKYSDVDAVTAMGVVDVENSLNHDRYNDTDTLTAVVASGDYYTRGEVDDLFAMVLIPAPIPATGQTNCFAGDGTPMTCADTGQDGDLQTGLSWPSPRFTVNGDGTARDNLTGLIWLRDGLCVNSTWEVSLGGVATLSDGQCGLTDASAPGDWRMPNIKEMLSLVDYNTGSLPQGHPFVNLPNSGLSPGTWFWTSTSDVFNTKFAWTVLLGSWLNNSGTPGVRAVDKVLSAAFVLIVRD